MKITEEKYTAYFCALKRVFDLHVKYNFGKSPDIPSGFSESLCRHLLEFNIADNRTHDAIGKGGERIEIKATGTKDGKTTISNKNEFDLLIWAFIDFESDSVSLYKLPRLLFSFTEEKGRKSIRLSSIAMKEGIAPQIYTLDFSLQTKT